MEETERGIIITNVGIILPNQRTDIQWTPYLATAYAEGFCEGEDATQEEQLEAWAYIIKTKSYKTLQGWYGRQARTFMDSGIIANDGTINWDYFDTLIDINN